MSNDEELEKIMNDCKESIIKLISNSVDKATPDGFVDDSIKIGELVCYSDFSIITADVGRAAILDGIRMDLRFPFRVNGLSWKYVARPQIPEIRVPFCGTECPEWLRGKKATLWFKDKSVDDKADSIPDFEDWGYVEFVMLHKD